MARRKILNSLQARLSLLALALTLLFALLAGGYAYWDSYHESHEFQDDLLRQISHFSENSPNPVVLDDNSDAKIYIQWADSPQSQRRLDLKAPLSEGFHLVREDDDNYRVFVRNTNHGQMMVMQENEYREELAEQSARSSAWPLVILSPLLALLSIWVVRRTMRPLQSLSRQVRARSDLDLTPLPVEALPVEVLTLVEAINQLLRRVDSSIKQQKRFIGDASHELRSPLTALSLQLERLEALPLGPEATALVQSIRANVQRNRALLEQLLSLARAQNDEAKELKTVVVPRIFRQVIADLWPLAERKNLDIGMLEDSRGALLANETEIYLLVKTLVDNAIKYAPEGAQIDLAVRETPGRVVLSVEDSGPGIPAEERARVLEPFYRILGSGQPGSGLGLAIAQTVAGHYRGEIRLLDAENFPSGLRVEVIFRR